MSPFKSENVQKDAHRAQVARVAAESAARHAESAVVRTTVPEEKSREARTLELRAIARSVGGGAAQNESPASGVTAKPAPGSREARQAELANLGRAVGKDYT